MSPAPGTIIRIESYKHDHTLHRSWDKTTIIHTSDAVVIGGNDRVKVTESDGREWRTREPAICTFGRGQWFNTIAMIREDGIHYYCNIGSPFSLKNNLLSYVDYDLDVKVFPDLSYTVLDEEEFLLHSQQMKYPESVVHRVKSALQEVIDWIEHRRGPFQNGFVQRWYERYLTVRTDEE
jgi:protein associated with RNAse G/E